MPLWKRIPTEEEHVSHSEMQGANRTFGTGFTYPDPTALGIHTSQAYNPYIDYPQPPPADAMAMDSYTYPHYSEQHNMLRAQPYHRLVHQNQTQATSLATNVWGGSGMSPYGANSLENTITLDPSLRGDNCWNRNQSLDCYQQSFQASSLSNQYNGSSFREPNMPAPGTNNVAKGHPESLSQSLNSYQQSLQASSVGNQYVGSSFRYTNRPAQGTNQIADDYIESPRYPSGSSTHYTPLPMTNDVERVDRCTKRGKGRHPAPGSDAHHHGSADQRSSQTQKPEMEQRRSTRHKKAQPAHRAQRLSQGEPSSAGRSQRSSNAAYEEVDGDKFVKIEDEWKLAGHHRDFREKLIMMDAEQPGAPVFVKGMSLDYTSYSPVTSAWTDDPRSMRDSEGQEVLFLPARPPHLPWNPECGHLMCEGLVMLDQDNVPIKDYPGAPRTLATSVGEAPGYLLQGLRSILGMTVKDVRARMLAEGDSKGGKRRSHGPTSLTNRMDYWRWRHNLPTWHPRRLRDATKTRVSIPSKCSKEGKTASNSGPDLIVEPAQMPDGPGSEEIEWDDF